MIFANINEGDSMKHFNLACACLLFTFSASAAVQVQEVDYKVGKKDFKGYLAFDDAQQDKRPGVLVIPEWWGMTDYPRDRAKQLAELGYVAFATDMYGEGKMTDDPKEAGKLATEVKKNPEFARERLAAGLEQLKKSAKVDEDKLAAIGYCFGGTMVLNMARWNMPVKGVVSFHGDLSNDQKKPEHIDSKVLVATGDADAFVPPEQVKAFEEEMKSAGADYKVLHYEGAHHAFTNPKADEHHIDNIKYNEKADKESWQAMKDFLAEVLKK
jgi:dienelactone hydrolase